MRFLTPFPLRLLTSLISLFLILAVSLSSSAQVARGGSNRIDFVPNLGQWEEGFLYKAGVKGSDIYLEPNCITYLLHSSTNDAALHNYHHHPELPAPVLNYHAYKTTFVGGDSKIITRGADQRIYYHNYFLGNDQSRWKGNVHPFGEINYKETYPGIDIRFTSDNGHFVYDFIVAPGADVGQIQLRYDGIDDLKVIENKLVITTSVGTVTESEPYVYQEINGKRVTVRCNYALNNNTVSFSFPDGYNSTKALVIDPSVVFATYSGSTASNYGFSATYDEQGNGYGAGEVFNVGYPTTVGAFQTVFGAGGVDIGITKFNATGTAQLYSTYLGGSGADIPTSMVVDPDGNLIVLGTSSSSDFPVTTGCYDNSLDGSQDIIITHFNASGTALLGSTFMGGSSSDGTNAGSLSVNYGDAHRGEVITDSQGNIYVAQNSVSTDFPTLNANQPVAGGAQDGVVFALNDDLSILIWSTYIGGIGQEAAYNLAFNSDQSKIYVSGGTTSNNFSTSSDAYHPTFQGGTSDGFIVSYEVGGNYPFLKGTFVGADSYDQCHGLQLDANDFVYAMGQTNGGNFPVTPGVYSNPNSSQFIIKMDSDLTTLLVSTVFGSGSSASNDISPTAFLVDTCFNIYMSGWGNTTGLPITPDAVQATTDGSDFYFIIFSPDAASLAFATYFGADDWDHVDGGTSRFDKKGTIYQAICSGSQSFPVTSDAYSTTNGDGYNLVLIKIATSVSIVDANAAAVPGINGCAPFDVQFDNFSNNATTYVWDFGDGSPTSTATNPSHLYPSNGVYTVMLAAHNDSACIPYDTTYLTITVASGSFVENTSTPQRS